MDKFDITSTPGFAHELYSAQDTLLSFDINRLTTDELWFTDMDNNDIKCIAID